MKTDAIRVLSHINLYFVFELSKKKKAYYAYYKQINNQIHTEMKMSEANYQEPHI